MKQPEAARGSQKQPALPEAEPGATGQEQPETARSSQKQDMSFKNTIIKKTRSFYLVLFLSVYFRWQVRGF